MLRVASGRLCASMADDSRPVASPPVPIGPPRAAVPFGAGVAFGQLPSNTAAHQAGGGFALAGAPPADLSGPHAASSLPRSDLTDPLTGMSGTSSGAPSPQKQLPSSGSLRAASHPGWSLPPVAPRAHRRGVSSDASSLGPDPVQRMPGAAAAAALAAGVIEGDDRPRSSGAGSGSHRQRAAPPPTAASLVRAEESENRLRRGQSLLLDEAHTAGGIAQVCVRHIGLLSSWWT